MDRSNKSDKCEICHIESGLVRKKRIWEQLDLCYSRNDIWFNYGYIYKVDAGQLRI